MNPKCTCADKQSTSSHFGTKFNICESESKISIDFGKVPFFNQASKEIEIDLEGLQDKAPYTFNIKKAVKLYYDDDFTIVPSDGKIEKGALILKLKCCYRPKIPFLKNVQSFNCEIGPLKLTITARGESRGPVVSVSERHIHVFQTPKSPKGKQVFLLKNFTNIPAKFMIDVDTDQKLFKVTPLKGIVTKEKYIKVFFNPREFGVYSQKLFCLIFGGEPIVVNVTGIYSEEYINPNHVSFIPYPFLFEETILYDGYFRNFIFTMKDKKHSPAYVVPRYIDMGKVVQIEDEILTNDTGFRENSFTSQRQLHYSSRNFKVVNELKHDITVNWTEDDPVFKIFPKVAVVPGEDCKYFKCIFTPSSNESVYFRKFTAQVYWVCEYVENQNPNQTIIIPLNISINLQGNSYPKEQHSLINIEIKPSKIIFPPSLVNTVAYENFTIINKLNRPIIFKIYSPPNR